MSENLYSASVVKSPIGQLQIIMQGKDLAGITWPKDKRKFDWTTTKKMAESPQSKKMAQLLLQYFKNKKMNKKIWTELTGTELQIQVWQTLLEIPFGETKTYSEIAQLIKRPKATRAVASAIGKNPISILIPCHRVIGKNNSLTGFAGGLKAKKWLLAWEQSK